MIYKVIQATIAFRAIVACGVTHTSRETGFVVVATTAYRALETGSHTGCLQAESVLAWLAACCWAWPVCLRLSQGARK